MCFDTSKSPIRNIQRMGRTGRHRDGRVVYILASGKEAEDYQSNLMARHVVNVVILLGCMKACTP